MRSSVQYLFYWDRTRGGRRPDQCENAMRRRARLSDENLVNISKSHPKHGTAVVIALDPRYEADHYAFESGRFVLIAGNPHRESGVRLRAVDVLRSCPNTTMLEQLVPVINGGFSLVAFYPAEDRLVVARDRFGLTHVYYTISDNVITVGTGPLATARAAGCVEPCMDFLARYCLFRYDEVWGHEATPLKHTQLVPPATMCIISNTVSKRRYWSFETLTPSSLPEGGDLGAMGWEHLLRSTKTTVFGEDYEDDGRSIVALSGGMDSSSVAAACHLLGNPLPAFTASYDQDVAVNEPSAAQDIARVVCKEWMPIGLNRDQFLDAWAGAYDFHELPLASSSFVGYDLLTKTVRALGYNRIIMGGSGDDLFAGNYPCYLYHLADLFVEDSERFDKELEDWIRLHCTAQYPKSLSVFWQFLMTHVDLSVPGRITPRPQILEGRFSKPLALRAALGVTPAVKLNAGSYLKSLTAYGYWFSMKQPGVLPIEEAAGQYGVEFLDPFLMDEFFDFCWALPPEKKIRNGVNKVLLRSIMAKILPQRTVRRADKVGFDVPFAQWAREHDYTTFMADALDSPSGRALEGIVDIGALRESCVDASYAPVHPMFIWQVVNAALWLDKLKTH